MNTVNQEKPMSYDKQYRYGRRYDSTVALWRKINTVIVIVSIITIGVNMIKLLG